MPSKQNESEPASSDSLEHRSDLSTDRGDKPRWSKPEITSFKPLAEAESSNRGLRTDAISNLS